LTDVVRLRPAFLCSSFILQGRLSFHTKVTSTHCSLVKIKEFIIIAIVLLLSISCTTAPRDKVWRPWTEVMKALEQIKNKK